MPVMEMGEDARPRAEIPVLKWLLCLSPQRGILKASAPLSPSPPSVPLRALSLSSLSLFSLLPSLLSSPSLPPFLSPTPSLTVTFPRVREGPGKLSVSAGMPLQGQAS